MPSRNLWLRTWTRISVLTLLEASCSPVAPREEHRLSISSMKIVVGAMALAISNKHLTMRSDSPLRSSGFRHKFKAAAPCSGWPAKGGASR